MKNISLAKVKVPKITVAMIEAAGKKPYAGPFLKVLNGTTPPHMTSFSYEKYMGGKKLPNTGKAVICNNGYHFAPPSSTRKWGTHAYAITGAGKVVVKRHTESRGMGDKVAARTFKFQQFVFSAEEIQKLSNEIFKTMNTVWRIRVDPAKKAKEDFLKKWKLANSSRAYDACAYARGTIDYNKRLPESLQLTTSALTTFIAEYHKVPWNAGTQNAPDALGTTYDNIVSNLLWDLVLKPVYKKNGIKAK